MKVERQELANFAHGELTVDIVRGMKKIIVADFLLMWNYFSFESLDDLMKMVFDKYILFEK